MMIEEYCSFAFSIALYNVFLLCMVSNGLEWLGSRTRDSQAQEVAKSYGIIFLCVGGLFPFGAATIQLILPGDNLARFSLEWMICMWCLLTVMIPALIVYLDAAGRKRARFERQGNLPIARVRR